MAYEQGAFDGITSIVSPIADVDFSFQPPPPPVTQSSVLEKYNTPEAAKAAIDRGDAKLTDFPPEMRGLISSIKTPTVNP